MKMIERMLLAYAKMINPSEVVPNTRGCMEDVFWYVPMRRTLPTLAIILYVKVAIVTGSSGDVSLIIKDADMTSAATIRPVLKVSMI